MFPDNLSLTYDYIDISKTGICVKLQSYIACSLSLYYLMIENLEYGSYITDIQANRLSKKKLHNLCGQFEPAYYV